MLLKRVAKFAILLALTVSCRSIPVGEAPSGPIAPPLDTAELPSDISAVNLMITALLTTCPELMASDSVRPRFSNEFFLADPAVNHMPMELWRTLLRMNLVEPCHPGATEEQYRLVSEFEKMDTGMSCQWTIKVCKAPLFERVWQKTIVFNIPSRTQ